MAEFSAAISQIAVLYIATVLFLGGFAYILGAREMAHAIFKKGFIKVPIWILQRIAEFAIEIIRFVFRLDRARH